MISYTRMRLSPVLRTRDHPPLTYVTYTGHIHKHCCTTNICDSVGGGGGGKWEGYFFTLGGGGGGVRGVEEVLRFPVSVH
jgi:hypothetical protein